MKSFKGYSGKEGFNTIERDGERACAGEASPEGRLARRPPVSFVTASRDGARAANRFPSKQGRVSLVKRWMCSGVI